jgi:hypothetical protein
MTDDLNDRLHRAADDGGRPLPARPSELLIRARKDRRRRSLFAAGGGTAVAAVAVGAIVFGFSALPGSEDADGHGPSVVDHDDDPPGTYELDPVSEAEVVRRCGLQLENSGKVRLPEGGRMVELDWTKPHKWRFNPISKQIDSLWRESLYVGGGPDLEVRYEGSWYMAPQCSVPEADLAAGSGRIQGEPVDADDTDGVLRQCGEIAGYDFSDWDVMSAMGAVGGVEAVLQSQNDHTATCTIEAPDGITVEPSVDIFGMSDAEYTRTHLGKSTALPYCVTLEPYEPSDALAMAPYEGEAVYTGSGNIYRPDGKLVTDITELRFELPDGTTVTQQVKDAKWAVRFAYQMPAGGQIHVTMLDAAGNVVAQRDAMDSNCFDD